MALQQSKYYMDVPDLTEKHTKGQIPGGNVNATDADLYAMSWGALWIDKPPKPDRFYTYEEGTPTVNATEERVERFDTWVEQTTDQKREALSQDIENQRYVAEISQTDLRADPGRVVVMDEANAMADSKAAELDAIKRGSATEDEQLNAFDSKLDPASMGAVATSKSLYTQAQSKLIADLGLIAEDQASLEKLKVDCEVVINAGDDAANIPVVDDNIRRVVGVSAEGYGLLRVRRIESGGFWYVQFELKIDRELDVEDYWIALYLDDLNTTYLATPRLSEVKDGIYETPLSHAQNTDQIGYLFTLCYKHISQEQFEKVGLAAGKKNQLHIVRWGGNTSGTVQPTVSVTNNDKKGKKGKKGK